MIQFPTTARGAAVPASEEDIRKEDGVFFLAADWGFLLCTDSGEVLSPNVPDFGYTNPNLHRRIDNDAEIPQGSDYPFVVYDEDGNAYKQNTVIGVWDGIHSYRTIETFIHDEESETCEIP